MFAFGVESIPSLEFVDFYKLYSVNDQVVTELCKRER